MKEIKVEFEFFGALRRKSKHNKISLTLPARTTIEDAVKKELGYSEKESSFFGYVINEKSVGKKTILQDGDTVKILLLIGGGHSSAQEHKA